MKADSKYYPAFDYLRIVLALTVALEHAGIAVWDGSANYAVQVFFALSGWLIGGILLRSSPRDLPKFYFHRAARIWIPYFIAIALLIVASLLKEKITAKWLEIFFYDATFVYNFFGVPQLEAFKSLMPLDGTGNHFWSICAEEQFYLVAPLLISVLARRSIWFWCLISAAALASPIWSFFGSISLGVLAATIQFKAGDWHTGLRPRLGLLVAAIGLLAAVYFGLIGYRLGGPLSAISIVLFAAHAGNHSRFAKFMGGVSYPMYLNHWIGVFIANAVFAHFGMRDTFICRLTGVVVAFGFAAVLYSVVDLQVRKHRDEYFTRPRGLAVAICGFALIAIGAIGGAIYALA